MSQENENRNEEGDTKENLEDSEEESKEQEDKSPEELLQEKNDKIKELEALIVKKKKETKDNQDSPKESDGDYLTKEEAVLLKEMDIEDLDKLKAVQKGEGHTSLKEAKESDLFQSYIERKAEEKRKKEAKLGASRGSGGGESKFRPGMTDEEHRKAWEEARS